MLRAIDLVLRFIYVAAIPPILAILNAVLPIGSVMISAAIATTVALLGTDRWHARVDRIPLVGRALGGMGKLGEFYREHPPKPLIYYLFYPVLLPVILFMREPRREFLLYRKLNVVALLIGVIGGVVEYYRHWHPVIPLGLYLAQAIANVFFQLLATFVIAMPLVTTILMLHQRHYKKRLVALLVCVAVTGAVGVFYTHEKTIVPAGVAARIRARTHYAERLAFGAFENALNAAWQSLHDHPDDIEAAQTEAREALQPFYLADEAKYFRLWVSKQDQVIAIYIRSTRGQALWIARDAKTLIKSDFHFENLPPDAYKPLGIKPR